MPGEWVGSGGTGRLGDLRVGRSKIQGTQGLGKVGALLSQLVEDSLTWEFLASISSSLFALSAPLGGLSGLPGAYAQPATQPPGPAGHGHLLCRSKPILGCRSGIWLEAQLRTCLEATGISRGS